MSRNVLITGGNSGIGYEMALALAGKGDRVVVAARDMKKSEAAIQQINAQHPGAKVEAMSLDLSDFSDIDRFARELLARMPVIDVFIMNAGLYTVKLHKLKNGYEGMIGIMHFGHFRLAQQLQEAIKKAPQGRIIVTSSVMHKFGQIKEASFTDPSQHSVGMASYAQAKLANLLFTRELAKRLQGTRVTVNAFHPGGVATGIYRETGGFFNALMRLVLLTPAQGADTAVWLATAPEGASMSGEYFVKRKKAASSARSRDPELAARLWALSEQAMKGA